MTEYDLWKIFPKNAEEGNARRHHDPRRFPARGEDSSPRSQDFLRSGDASWPAAKEIEVTNLGSPEGIPQFKDAEQVLTAMRSDAFKKRCERAQRSITTRLCMTAVIDPRDRRGSRHRAEEEGNRPGPHPHDGLYRPRAPLRQLRHDAFPVLERGRALHQEGGRCRNQDVRHRQHDLGQPDQRRHQAGRCR